MSGPPLDLSTLETMAREDTDQLLAELATFHRYSAGHYIALMKRIDWFKRRAAAWKALARARGRELVTDPEMVWCTACCAPLHDGPCASGAAP